MKKPSKMCYTCRKVKPLTEFGKNRAKKDGLCGSCKECARMHGAATRKRTAARTEIFGTVTSKRCTKCGEVKSADNFSPNAYDPSGLQPDCKPCRAEYMREYMRGRYRKEGK